MYLRSCILVPAILVPEKDRPVLWYKHVGNSDKDRPVLWYKHVGVSDKDRPILWYTQVRNNFAVLAMVHPMHPNSKLYQGIHEAVTWYY